MTTLFHYTCLDHGVPGIERDGLVRTLADIIGADRLPSGSGFFAWFTDLDAPFRDALGLTSRSLTCDRAQARYAVIDATSLHWWMDVRHELPHLRSLEWSPGALPQHWWISPDPVPVERVA